jgi:hypothetical protein
MAIRFSPKEKIAMAAIADWQKLADYHVMSTRVGFS